MSSGFSNTRIFGPVALEIGWAPPVRYLMRRHRLLKLLRQVPAGVLLEVGCGSGALLHELAQAGHDSIGLETSEPAMRMAKGIARLGDGRQHLQASPDPDWSGRFDLVCAFDVLEHIEDDGAALDQWLSWLRPGGSICLTVPAHTRRWGAGDEWAGHYRRYDRAGLSALLLAKGLAILHFECYGFPLANLTEALGNRTYRRLLSQRDRAYSNEEASSFSGVERSDYLGLFGKLDTIPGRTALRAAMLAQSLTARTDLGSGYLVLARMS